MKDSHFKRTVSSSQTSGFTFIRFDASHMLKEEYLPHLCNIISDKSTFFD